MCTQTWAVWVRSLAYRRLLDTDHTSSAGMPRGYLLRGAGLVLSVPVGATAYHIVCAWLAHIG